MDLDTLAHLPSWDWPPEASGILADVLGDATASDDDRLLAAELAGEFIVAGDEVAQALLAVLRDPRATPEVRGQAAISLGPTLEGIELEMFDDEPGEPQLSGAVERAVRQALHEVYLDAETPKLVRRRALEASVRGSADWHTGAVRAAYYSGDAEWRLTAVFCMEHVKGFEKEILEALKSDDPQLEYHAVEAAGTWEIDEAWPHVLALVSEPDTERSLLLAAIQAVALIRPGEAAEALDDLAHSRDEEIADAVYEALSLAGVDDWEFEDEDEDEDDDGFRPSRPFGNGSRRADDEDDGYV